MIIAESGSEKYLTKLSNGSISISSDTTQSKGGGGEYFRPHDLLCAGLASCLNISVRMVLEKMNLKYEKIITTVDMNRDQEESTTFLYDVDIIGNIDNDIKESILSKVVNCPVRKTLSKNIGFQPMDKGK